MVGIPVSKMSHEYDTKTLFSSRRHDFCILVDLGSGYAEFPEPVGQNPPKAGRIGDRRIRETVADGPRSIR